MLNTRIRFEQLQYRLSIKSTLSWRTGSGTLIWNKGSPRLVDQILTVASNEPVTNKSELLVNDVLRTGAS